MQQKTISYQDKNIFYRLIGEGEPLLLLHGFVETGEVWQQQIHFLKNNFQLIIPDLPGSGASEFNPQLSTIELHADAVKAIIDKENIKQFTFIGHSLGGYVALAFAEKYPQLLKGFGLFHSTAYEDSDERKELRLKAIDFIKDKGVYEFIKATTPNLFTDDFKNSHPNKINELIERGKNFLPEALIQYYKIMLSRPDRTHVLRNFVKPILFIIGELDKVILLKSSLQQCHIPKQSHIHILKNSAHMGMWEEAANANLQLSTFIKNIL